MTNLSKFIVVICMVSRYWWAFFICARNWGSKETGWISVGKVHLRIQAMMGCITSLC